MSKTFIAVDRNGRRRVYYGNYLPSWWIKLSLRLRNQSAEPLVTFGVRNDAEKDFNAISEQLRGI